MLLQESIGFCFAPLFYHKSERSIIAKLQKTVLSVFHELNLACRYCDYLYVLKDGYIINSGIPEDVVTPEMLSDVFAINADVITSKSGKPYIIYNGSI
jgi:iron complex transport system ATP-binding protein